MNTAAAKQNFALVQGLRAVAALSVAFLHICYAALSLNPSNRGLYALYHLLPWEAGVDIFFVISGFVIVTASTRFFAASGGQLSFLRRRLLRIVPLYWLMTTLFLLTLAAARQDIHGDIGGPLYILASYFFIPFARPDGVVQPAFGLGWTLNYEMFFYLTFTLFLALPKQRAVPGLCLALLIFVCTGQAHLWHGTILTTWSSPIILEFCAGMLIALLAGNPGTPRLFYRGRLALTALAFAIFILAPAGWPDLASQGIPATCLVAAASLGPPARNRHLINACLVLGDASYALYLVHPFIMRGFEILEPRIPELQNPVIYICVCLGTAQLAALGIHRWLEMPLKTRRLARLA